MSLHGSPTFMPESTVCHPIAIDSCDSAVLRDGYQYWRSRCGKRRFPSRENIRPRDIATSLRYVSLLKVEDGDFIYRIVGDVIVMSYGLPLQNRRLSDLAYDEPGFSTYVLPVLRSVVEDGAPKALRSRIGRDILHVNFTDCENLLLPLGPADDTVDHILAFSSYLSHPFG